MKRTQMTFDEAKTWIDNATLEQLLRKWRFETSGSKWFEGEIGKYYKKIMSEKRSKNPAEWTVASKRIG